MSEISPEFARTSQFALHFVFGLKRSLVLSIAALLLFCWRDADAAGPADWESGLVGDWRYENCDGKTVKDLSTLRNNGVIEGGILCKEKATSSLELDGCGARMLICDQQPFGLADALTAALWIKAVELRNNTVLFGVPHTNKTWTTPMFGMYGSERHVVFGMWGDGSNKALVESSGELPMDTWVFLTATYDGAKVRLFVNGSLNSERPCTGKIASNGLPLIIGKGLGLTKPSFKGRIGELRLYARALDAGAVLALYETTKVAYDLSAPPPAARRWNDGTVTVETHGNNPESRVPWRPHPTRLLELLEGYQPSGNSVKLDQYGGWMDRPGAKATGFFHVEKIEGRDWLIDPDGFRFVHIAINAVAEPKEVKANYGSVQAWAEAVTAQLRTNGFNGLGNSSSTSLQQVKPPLVWVLRKEFMSAFAHEKKITEPAAGHTGYVNQCMPVFLPDFEKFCDNYGKVLAASANDPSLLGIMSDNELQCPVDLLARYLSLDPANPNLKPGRDAALAWLSARKGPSAANDPASITQRDCYEFIAYAFERYYRIVSKTIRKYDPNHLYLGSRIHAEIGQFDNPWFWKMLLPYHDVVSVNLYGYWGPQPEVLANWEGWAGRPILLTEWYAKAGDVPGLANTHGAGWLVHTQEDRGRYYQHFVLNALECKNIVGFHWLKYLDDPKEAVALDCAGGANKGIFDLEGKPHLPLLNCARAVNREVYPLIEFLDSRNK
jgi:hypothetical protein